MRTSLIAGILLAGLAVTGCGAAASPGDVAAAARPEASTPARASSSPVGQPARAADGADRGHRLPPVPGAGHMLTGVQLSWDVDSPATYVARSGVRPAVYGDFVSFPLSPSAQELLRLRASALQGQGAALFLTVEPDQGLDSVTPESAAAFARQLHDAVGDLPVYLRFAHEMNGSWYAWGEQPTEYVAAFRALATAIHAAPGTVAMVWSPNYGGGYPFHGGAHEARPGTRDFAVLDTDHDGKLTMRDDPYAPYYPGDDAVDWVGLTDYFWGLQYPWGENELPDPGRFGAQLTGTYHGPSGDERALPDFFAGYAVGHLKPMALSETGAFWDVTRGAAPGGPTELAVKSAWLGQVLAPSNATRFPRLALVLWFEHDKKEAEVHGDRVDWGLTHAPALVDLLRTTLTGSSRFVQAPLPSS